MRKKSLFLMVLVPLLFLLSSCDNAQEQEGYKEDIYEKISGTYDISLDGNFDNETITFTKDGNFTMEGDKGCVLYGDYNPSENNKYIVITYAEDEDGNELLTDEDYDLGGLYSEITFSGTIVYLDNFIYYRDTPIVLFNKR